MIGLSTSGNSGNVLYAAVATKAKGSKIIGFCGKKECRMDHLFDVVIHDAGLISYGI